MGASQNDFMLLKRIADEIDEYFKVTFSQGETRSTDIYDFIKKKDGFKDIFPTGKEFNQFLRKMQQAGLIKAVIPNSIVDTSNPNFYQWRFYRKSQYWIKNEISLNSHEYTIGFFCSCKLLLPTWFHHFPVFGEKLHCFLNFQPPKIQIVAVSFFPGLRCIRHFREIRTGEAPYPGLFKVPPTSGWIFRPPACPHVAVLFPYLKLHKVLG